MRFLFACALKSCPWRSDFTSSFCQTFAHHKLLRIRPEAPGAKSDPFDAFNLAARTVLTAKELKDVQRKTLDENDRILVVEVSGGWASRGAENNLGELVLPKGGPALALWQQRWGE
jgi:hypothetical protein